MENTCSSKQRGAIMLSTVWIFLLASLLHFGYSLTGFYPLSFICAVNESTWEHIKIIFFGALFTDVFLYFKYFKGNANFIAGLAPSLASIMVSVPMMFYGYMGVIGRDVFILDLIIAYLAGFFAQRILLRFTCGGKDFSSWKTASALAVVIMIFMFFLFTWYPPNLPLFQPPVV
ncbi:MAG: DUF6512 family protein [Clostridia bacterium]|nr:DUF6512 family protein [Clostridia bacterium]